RQSRAGTGLRRACCTRPHALRGSRCDHAPLAASGGARAPHHGRGLPLDSRRHGGARLARTARTRADLARPAWLDPAGLPGRLMTGPIHIIGAGLSGLAAAIELTTRGRSVVVHEATTAAGGRCRSYHDRSVGMVIDNGNHLLLSGNHSALSYLRAIGAAERLVG